MDWLDQATLKAPRQSLCRGKDPGTHKMKIVIAHEPSDHRPSCLSFPRAERKESYQMLRQLLVLGGSG